MDYRELLDDVIPFPEKQANKIKSTRIRVARNLEGFMLGPGIKNDQRLEVEALVTAAFSNFTDELSGDYYSLATMSDEQRA